ncbi:LLM class F420-dependent oxidoreductase [Nocardioides sp. zg-536]|uniref:LLM class F420-dependent oxidoreductase n=1 Tax=Nocardioides faecalis TaxID=2803858 RepID=A0A938Y0X7_9ACTN|nr:LLM class F420-dependent oxidoreductase [Nocardioides faecalis]MBM9460127.1 LLM class F420-dependent oxidoreductase [Nocardioides faecalis]QVI60078.1 LLM class F420-dependent oxidoreductase [Nocardioides faecalis]
MRVGITSPVVTGLPGFFGAWEQDAGIEELATIADAADRLGFDHLTCSEHVAVPTAIAEQRGGRYWDPLATLSFLAARTTRIRLATQVLVLGYHHPVAIAKRYGTLDLLSGGRLVLGLGIGSIEEEFDLLGADFAGRGAVADDALPALRAALSGRTPTYDGARFAFSDVVVEPCAVQPRVPFWIGGHTPRSLRRAVEHGDGWIPFGLPHDRLREMLDRAPLPDGFEVVLGAGRPVDPVGEPDRTRRALERTVAAGASVVNVHVSATSADHYVDQLARLAELAGLAELALTAPQEGT